MNHKLLMIASVLFLSYNSFAQKPNNGNIKGKIIDKATKQSVPGAIVKINNTQIAGATDTAGVFVLKNIDEGNYALTITFIGYQEKLLNDVRVTRNKTNYIEVEIEESQQSLDEVEVTSYKYENSVLTPVSMYSFSRDEISRNPGAQGDIFRAIGMLPGVTSSGGEFSAISVRGQGTRDNIYIVDDIPVFSLAHLDGSPNGFDDPNGGRFSIFAPRVIDNAQFQAGGYAAQYGRRSAAYLGLGIKEGNKEGVTVDGQLDLLGGTINYDGPSYVLKNTSLFLSARYQDFTKLVEIVDLKQVGIPKFQDFIFKSTTQLGSKNKLSLIAIYSPESFVRDTSNVRADKKLNSLFLLDRKSSQTILGLNLRTLTGERSYWKNVVYYSTTDAKNAYGKAYPLADINGTLLSGSLIGVEQGVRKINLTETKMGYRSIYTVNFKNHSQLTAGIDFDISEVTNYRRLSRQDTSFVFGANDYRPSPTTYYSIINPMMFDADYSNDAVNGAAYIDYSFTPIKRLTLNVGARYDYTGFTDQHTVSPRLSGSYKLNESNTINFASGIYYQDPSYASIADQPKNKKLENQQTIQYILGYKKYFTPNLKLTVESWYKTFDKLIVRPVSGTSEQTNSGTGYAYGLDINLTKRLSKNYHGQIGYSYMVSKRNDNDGMGEYDFTFSQPHQFNMLLSYKKGKHWVFSGKFRYASGKPTDSYVIHDDVLNDPNNLKFSQEITGKGAKRLPDVMSLDLRTDYRFQIKRLGLTVFLDIVNILNRTNPNQEQFNAITGKTYYEGLTLFPSFGLKFEF